MTTLQDIELCCPLCGTDFRSQAVASTVAANVQSTDFRQRAPGAQSLPYLVHMCNHCGYTGVEEDFAEDVDVMPWVKDFVWNELAPKVGGRAFCGSEKYEAAARVAEWQGRSGAQVAELMLRAAWCCEDESDIEAERYFRRLAAWGFERVLVTSGEKLGENRATLTYLVGELWRRIGDLKAARVWFNRVAAEVTDPRNQQWLVDAARQQRDRPREWFN
jgi:uncharacterized protein (DUF2225 family)